MNRTKRTLSYTFALLGTLGLATTASLLDLGRPRQAAANAPEVVPVELALLVDTSGSVDEFEYQLQQEGYAEAFRNSELAALIERQGGIAVAYIEWSSVDHQSIRIDWTRLDTVADCNAFAGQIAALQREVEGDTRMAPALEFAAAQMAGNAYIGLKRVIDVSGDGRCQNYDFYREGNPYSENYGTPWEDVIADMADKVDQVNGICITTSSGVADFYRDVLPQGDQSFMMQVADFVQFEEAILQKLQREISTLPGMFD